MDQDKNKATNSFDNRETFIAARDALDRGETDEAMKLYMKLSEILPNSSEAALGISRAAFLLNDLELCADQYKRALELEPSLGVFQRIYHLAPRDTDRLRNLVQALKQRKLYSEGLRFTDRLVEKKMKPEAREKILALRKELLNLSQKSTKDRQDGELMEQGSRLGRAAGLGAALLVLVLFAATGYFIFNLSRINIKSGRDALNQAKDMEEQFRTSERGGDKIIKKLKDAEKIFEGVVKQEGQDASQARYYLGLTSRRMAEAYQLLDPSANKALIKKCRQRSLQEFELAVKANKHMAEARLELASLALRRGDVDEAKMQVSKALESASSLAQPFKTRRELIKARATGILEDIERRFPGTGKTPGSPAASPGPSPGASPVNKPLRSPAPEAVSPGEVQPGAGSPAVDSR